MISIDRVTCDDALRLLDSYVDRELTSQEQHRVSEHLAVCEQCTQTYQFEQRLLEKLREKIQHLDIPDDVPDDLMTKIKSRLATDG